MKNKTTSLSSSFRDPNGQIYCSHGDIYRQITRSGYEDYQTLIKSGLYERLTADGQLIPHREASIEEALDERACVVIIPDKIDFISYPYEWSFSQLKKAALLTLDINRISLKFGMILKDATSYNIQYHHGNPILIDTGSFQIYLDGTPWAGYQQFCTHFLAPLILMSKIDIRLNSLLKQYIDGIPLDLASKLLPKSTYLSPSLLGHIHLHAKSQLKYGSAETKTKNSVNISNTGMLGLIDNLKSVISSLKWKPIDTEWGDYYEKTNYSDDATKAKGEIVHNLISSVNPNTVWDLGANNGHYSRIAAKTAASVISFDIDPVAVELNFREVHKKNESRILPLLMDLTNPSPSIGWAHQERDSMRQRGPVDVVMALALIHHLAISNNVPLPQIAEFFASLAKYLILEFVPKSDSQVKILLANREDIFPTYHSEGVKKAFSSYYEIVSEHQIQGTHRTIFFMKKKTG